MTPPPDWATTWIEHWPPAVAELSFRQRGLALSAGEACALGRRNGVAIAAFGHEPAPGADEATLRHLAERISVLLLDLGGDSAFIRLGSRSPKDTPLALMGGLRVTSGTEAVLALTAGSTRMAFDLRVAMQAGIDSRVYVREWLPIAWHEEWRGFLRHGRLVAASQYNHRHPLPVSVKLETVRQAICRMEMDLAGALYGGVLQDVVFDLWVPSDDARELKLIELNPWGTPTDSCLFNWDDADLDNTLRWRGETKVDSISLSAK